MEESESELQVLRKSLQEEENTFTEEINKLRRKLDDEEHAKNSIERKVKGLEDEISDLKTSVAELSSSRAGIEAELDAARHQIAALLKECAASLEIQKEMKGKMVSGESERRRLHNQVQELKGNIRVFCRMRPLLGEESERGDDIRHVNISSEKNIELTKFAEDDKSATKNSKYDFEFDK